MPNSEWALICLKSLLLSHHLYYLLLFDLSYKQLKIDMLIVMQITPCIFIRVFVDSFFLDVKNYSVANAPKKTTLKQSFISQPSNQRGHHVNLYGNYVFHTIIQWLTTALLFLSAEPRLPGLIHPERSLCSLSSIWGYSSQHSQPTIARHWGSLRQRFLSVPNWLPDPSQATPWEGAPGSLCECWTE